MVQSCEYSIGYQHYYGTIKVLLMGTQNVFMGKKLSTQLDKNVIKVQINEYTNWILTLLKYNKVRTELNPKVIKVI